ncbi:hypothetical protein [Candidatus Berkiella aquae]|uniref:Uncharacterized protein n=1 Tax=Candidatus Berkiella aquae TaxID=295108 RepID=A0AAE3HWY7_9GAMM|nr:hypothetical protein [Candidatus Berkiella aquae]MCS5712108.1 hypothetical protein [Candidatus Berkiella aquae]
MALSRLGSCAEGLKKFPDCITGENTIDFAQVAGCAPSADIPAGFVSFADIFSITGVGLAKER